MTEFPLEPAGPRTALTAALDAASTAALRIVCALGLANAALMLLVTVGGHRTSFAITAASVWVGIWWLMLWRAEGLRVLLRARPALLVPTAIVGMAPTVLDGGLEGTLGTQALWLTWVAAVTVSAPMTLATAAGMSVASAAALAASGMTAQDLFSGPDRFQATLLICTPIVAAGVALAIVGVFRRVLAGCVDGLEGIRAGAPASTPALTRLLRDQPASPVQPALASTTAAAPVRPWGLTQTEHDVLVRLRAGLTIQQIALERNGSVLTVRTHIKRAKRKVGARTLSELIARTWPTN